MFALSVLLFVGRQRSSGSEYQIETDEGYIFLYKDKTMDLERKISLDVRNASLETILRRILDEKTEFGISERQVVLYTRKEAAKTSPADTPSRKITVRGTVRDAGGNVLIGVSVVEKGTTNGTATDANGLYSIDVKSAEAILTFSYLSYKTVESAVSTRTQLDVTLEEDAARLDDVVIIGYGAQTKASITGALATVDTKELVKAPVASITNVLAGSVPGVATVQTSGQPGNDAATIYIRGVGSLNSNYAAPLVLVDGVEREFSQIDPNEISVFVVPTALFSSRPNADRKVAPQSPSVRLQVYSSRFPMSSRLAAMSMPASGISNNRTTA